MKILRGYAEVANNGPHNWSSGEKIGTSREMSREKKEHKSSGDTISLSEEAREMLATGGSASSVCAQDATYDQHGYVLRQVDNLRGDLRNLTSHLLSFPEGMALAGHVHSMQTKLNSIQATV